MNGRIPFETVRNTILIMGIIALGPAAARAADPNASAKRQEAKPQAMAAANEPKPPAARSPASLTRQTPLGEAVDLLRNSTTPPLKILVLWRPLAEAGIYRDTPIGIDAIAGLSVSQFVELLALSLSAGASARIGYTVDRDVITLATTNALPTPRQITRVYNISDLVAPPARYSLSSMGFPMGYGSPVVPPGGRVGSPSYGSYAVNPGTNVSQPGNSTSGRTGPSSRVPRRH
jgi:hypothetical protein